ncbi:rluD, partial [Symbiodinium sp. CCMP2456]
PAGTWEIGSGGVATLGCRRGSDRSIFADMAGNTGGAGSAAARSAHRCLGFLDLIGIAFMCHMADALASWCRSPLSLLLRRCGHLRDARGGQKPHDTSDRHVLTKDPGTGVCDGEAPVQLLDLAKATFGESTPIFGDAAHWHGFLHRLDVPCSGLVLLATTYEAFYDLQLQLHTGELERDYALLCHGWLHGFRVLEASLHRFAAGGRGRQSRSLAKALALSRRSFQAFTFAAVRIMTGRQHQIRRHFAHVGHPVVHDSLYGSVWTLSEDSTLCTRNWLHRYRLAFRVGGSLWAQ